MIKREKWVRCSPDFQKLLYEEKAQNPDKTLYQITEDIARIHRKKRNEMPKF